MQDISAYYSMPDAIGSSCVIKPQATAKVIWDFYIVFLLLVVSIIVPFRLAFYPTEDQDWVIIYLAIDSQFLIDMVLTFFTGIIINE